jgi:dodecin
MPHHVYKLIEVVGSSPDGLQAAIERGVSKAAESVHNIRWFEVLETRGNVEDGGIANWQVTLKIGFTLD